MTGRIQIPHFQCTIINCGMNFDNLEDLKMHIQQAHIKRTKKPLVTSFIQEVSKESPPTTMSPDTESTKVKADAMPRMGSLGVGNPSATDQEVAIRGATEVRPGLGRWTSKMNRNALANPGASEWKSV
ncbi:hypothetical protein EG329_000136 [Mollisiaceae sp. DMI_Dod_QoI]|nr:hypothetical protein EG329_000136 [Helotiales sp. DMI_Dod_QoI]